MQHAVVGAKIDGVRGSFLAIDETEIGRPTALSGRQVRPALVALADEYRTAVDDVAKDIVAIAEAGDILTAHIADDLARARRVTVDQILVRSAQTGIEIRAPCPVHLGGVNVARIGIARIQGRRGRPVGGSGEHVDRLDLA